MTRKPIVLPLGGTLGVIAAALVLAVALNDGGTAEAQSPPVTFWKNNVPDLGQHSQSWCWVGAAANSFWWFADNGYDGLLGGPAKPWTAIDPLSTMFGSPCGIGSTWYDSRDAQPPAGDGSAIAGYPTVLRMIAQTTFKDVNQNAMMDGGEVNYCFSEGVEKWDYLIGLRDYVNTYTTGLVVHDIIDPAKCVPGSYGMKPVQPPTMPPTMMTLNPCGPGGSGVPGVNQVQHPPTFTDYMTELAAGQDVLLWMEGQYPLETAHVVTAVAYDNTPGVGAFLLGTVTISDPWTHTTNPPLPPMPSAVHNDGLIAPFQAKPDHNTVNVIAGTDPYNLCDVTQLAPLKIQCYYEDPPITPQVWQVVDMIFVSPEPATGPVGGVAELPAVADDSGWSVGMYAALAGGLAAAFVALTAGAWYARRRWAR